MATRNDITGDALISKKSTDAYRDGWDRIFGNKKPTQEVTQEVTQEEVKNDLKE